VNKLEEGDIDAICNISIEKAYFDVTNETIKDDSYGIYNDAYWSGYSYFELFLQTHKPFSYLFLKLPLEKMLDIYEIFHEMDFTSLLEYFKKRETESTILGTLCKKKKCSLTKLKEVTGININTLSKYRSSDEILYKASFQNIYKIAKYFEVPISLFVDSL
jgi:DNA-binding Xre family transcriptional regulator